MLIRNRKTISIIAKGIADERFRLQCALLDEKLENSLKVAFNDEFISQKRINRITNRFCSELLKK